MKLEYKRGSDLKERVVTIKVSVTIGHLVTRDPTLQRPICHVTYLKGYDSHTSTRQERRVVPLNVRALKRLAGTTGE